MSLRVNDLKLIAFFDSDSVLINERRIGNSENPFVEINSFKTTFVLLFSFN